MNKAAKDKGMGVLNIFIPDTLKIASSKTDLGTHFNWSFSDLSWSFPY